MPKSRGILPPRRFWMKWEEEFLRSHYADALTVDLATVMGMEPKRILAKANAMGLHKSIALISETARLRTMDPAHGSHRTRIQPGNVPANKGVKRPEGWAPGRMAESQFKPGTRPHTWVPVGSYRVVEGNLERKVNDLPGPNTVRWKPVARLVWEDAHGAVPAGHSVVFRPGKKTTDPAEITVDKLECLSRQELMLRNSYHTNYPPELASVVMLRAALNRQINRRKKEANHE